MKKLLLCMLLLVMLITLTSCAKSISKACKELTNVANTLNTAVLVADKMMKEDPTSITDEQFTALVVARDNAVSLAGTTCILNETVKLVK